ncbi:hypothetical protein ALT_2497 [Aspergillus lentulus]|uniref:Uncharacterized protein n=1 Tax=Aspergillus lentulus TaxID=293939 RepID=A0AAN4PF53_ASPLE|nr:uncharacterized protein IFM58399_07735 [Aspergillus lentulus]KAF4160239.1 hypothetical protein CNMCM6069_009310 [Aspergillus lentulus]KAF4170034.1 hypothetical protein CNMCM6936_005179 [Aspergillus lentulus]KAF4181844.1 hypothetical protein CNMCM8060_008215 [Aspergillus lentulus]KAF4189794.1 hypothetical protein CNMCM7927_006578 [Aspergillus lentulus]KAF4198112.1 hypothetical protein CNMCM8694_000796 [Aspergillus lentulus]
MPCIQTLGMVRLTETTRMLGWMYMSVIDYMRYCNVLNEYDWWFDLVWEGPNRLLRKTAYAVTATSIQIRFRAGEWTVVPVPTDSLSLPRGYLLTREKVGIGVGVPVAVGLLMRVYFISVVGGGGGRKERVVTVTDTGLDLDLDLDLPPPYPGLDDGWSTNEVQCGCRR